jgi:hypothetical protein
MKTMILLMFSFVLMTGSIFGQKSNFEYIQSDVKGDLLKTKPYDPHSKKPDNYLLPKFNSPTALKLYRSRLYQGGATTKLDTAEPYLDFGVAEKFPGSSKFYAKNPSLISSPYEKSFVLSPDTSAKHYLIIMNPFLNNITK